MQKESLGSIELLVATFVLLWVEHHECRLVVLLRK
jgi:hypothetical protein